MIRRHPDAVIAAHAMDRSRRELYVEGPRDRRFLAWLVANRLDPNTTIVEIEFVDLPHQTQGGNRGRLIQFAQLIGDREVKLKIFADADWDRLLNREVPSRVWLTDQRDLEGYLLHVECIDKVLRLGIGTDSVTAADALGAIHGTCRRLGLLRVMSVTDGLDLPFQQTRLERYVRADGFRISLDLDRYLAALLQNKGTRLTALVGIKKRLQAIETTYAGTPDRDLIHGKDALCILETLLSEFRLERGEATRLLWTSFDAKYVEGGSTLDAVSSFLCGSP